MCGGEKREQKSISAGTQRGSKRLGLPKIVQFGQSRALTQLGPSLYLRGYAPFNAVKSDVERLQVAQFSKCSWNGAVYLVAGYILEGKASVSVRQSCYAPHRLLVYSTYTHPTLSDLPISRFRMQLSPRDQNMEDLIL